MEFAQDHAGTPRRRVARRPASIFGRSLGFGAVTGGAIGLLIALTLVVIPTVTGATGGAGSGVLTSLGALVFVGSYAIGFGAIVGLVCGFVASIPLLIAQEIATSKPRPPVRGRSARPGLRRSVAGLIGGAGAALVPLGLAIANLAGHDAGAAGFFGWFATAVFFLGMLLAPYVVYGSPPKRRKPIGRRPAGMTAGPDLHSAE